MRRVGRAFGVFDSARRPAWAEKLLRGAVIPG